jgi:hypothetical protein
MKLAIVAWTFGLGLAACGGKGAAPAAEPAREPAVELEPGSCCCEFVAEHGDEPMRIEPMPNETCAGLGECVEPAACAADDESE